MQLLPQQLKETGICYSQLIFSVLLFPGIIFLIFFNPKENNWLKFGTIPPSPPAVHEACTLESSGLFPQINPAATEPQLPSLVSSKPFIDYNESCAAE